MRVKMAENPEFALVREVATRVRRHPRTIIRWIEDGTTFLPGEVVRVKDGYLIKSAAVDRIIDTGKKNLGENFEKRRTNDDIRRH